MGSATFLDFESRGYVGTFKIKWERLRKTVEMRHEGSRTEQPGSRSVTVRVRAKRQRRLTGSLQLNTNDRKNCMFHCPQVRAARLGGNINRIMTGYERPHDDNKCEPLTR